MMSNNKILTVSYGTFSCTLEGFDDSFGTMKAIAEYFRDLASDDRYFGAEPPQPDAEMLQRIAEREISRRVEARQHEGKIFLSAADPADEDVDGASDAISDDAAHADDIAAQAKADAAQAEADAAQAEADAAEAERAIKAAQEAEAEMARVQQERQEAEAEAKAQAERDAEAAKALEDTVIAEDEQDADVDLSALIAHADATDIDRTPRDLAAELPEAEAFFAGSDHAVADDFEDAPEAAGDSIAAKLDRIRAVVSQADSIADDDDGYSEDEHADGFAATEADDESVTADALADIEAALELDDSIAPQTEADKVDAYDDDEDDVASILASLEDNDDDEDDTAAAINLFEDTQDDAAEEVAEIVAAEPAEDTTAEEPRRVARVVKVKRADLEAAIAQGDLEEVGDDNFESSLSDDEEDELARELAAVTADVVSQDVDEDMSVHAMPGVDALAAIDENSEDDLSRLMAQADQHMDEEEGAQRRDAFAHLRAAVAAKKADDGLGAVDPEEEEGAYRNDLATVVKPRRPSAEGGRSARPDTTQRPAPLKLVAEQRVDSKVADNRGPVRPRRVAAVQEVAHAPSDASNFSDFAEDMGASNLSDLLEAAAAYMSFVEGREQFTRPQLMTKVRQVEKDDFSREDGLRSFGKLLRAGKIEKLKGGRFTVTGDIGFRPDARAAS